MTIKQLSVFIENREGSLAEVASILAKNNINIVSMSLADTSDYGMLRMIVSEHDKAKTILREANFSAMITEVIAIKLPNEMGTLSKLLEHFSDNNVSIEYMYALATSKNASIVMKISDIEKGCRIILDAGYELICTDEARDINS